MGRKRKIDTGLPMRLFFNNGAYFYINSKGREQKWIRLGTDKESAVSIANGLNQLKLEARERLFDEARLVDESVRQSVFVRDGFKCVYCGATSNLVTDHFIPFTMGGSSNKVNIVTACLNCNQSKGGRNPRDFIIDMMGLKSHILKLCLERF